MAKYERNVKIKVKQRIVKQNMARTKTWPNKTNNVITTKRQLQRRKQNQILTLANDKVHG